ncbi:hypothetical protein ES705_40320 [subsurface metagenome]
MPRVIDLVVEAIIQAGIDHAFCLPGGYTQFLIDGLYQHRDKINVIVSLNFLFRTYQRKFRKIALLPRGL